MGNSSSSDKLAGRMGANKVGSHLDRQREAVDKVKRLRDGVKLEEENHEKHKEKLALKHTWAELEEDLMENVVEPIKKWTGIAALQECSKPKSHIDSDDDEYGEVQEKPIQAGKSQNVQPRTTRDKVRSMIAQEYDMDI